MSLLRPLSVFLLNFLPADVALLTLLAHGQGTAYTPVTVGKVGKLSDRMAAFQQAPALSSAPGFSAASGGAGKKLTWSERQAAAKKQQEEEDAASAAAGAKSFTAAPAAGAPAPPSPAPPRAPSPPPFINVTARPSTVPSAPAAPPAPPAPPAGALAGAAEADAAAAREVSKAEAEEAAHASKMEKLSLAADEADKAAAVPRPRGQSAATGGKKARVLFAYEKEEDNELTLQEGEIVTDVEMVDEGWWSGSIDGRSGLYPSTFAPILFHPAQLPRR